MPYTIEWHASKNILIVTYQKTLTIREHAQLRKERAAALDQGPAGTMLLADMRNFDGFPDAYKLPGNDNILDHPNVRGSVIIVPEIMFQQLSRALVTDYAARLPLFFTSNLDDALTAAQHALG